MAAPTTIEGWLFQGWHAWLTFGALAIMAAGVPSVRSLVVLLLVALVLYQIVNVKAP